MTAYPKLMYGDPIYAAMQSEAKEAKSCNSCVYSESVFGKKICTKGKRHTSRCVLFVEKRGINK